MTDDILTARSATRRSLEFFNWNVLLRAVFDAVCGPSNFLFVALLLSSGIPGESMGRLAAVASIACVMQILILPLITRTAARKRFIIVAGMVEPLVLIGAVLVVPLLPPHIRFFAFVGAVFVAAAFLNMTRPAMDDWLASTIPDMLRGRYLGRRMQMLGLVTIVSLLAAGWSGDWASRQSAHGLSWVLAAGAIFGVLAILALTQVRDMAVETGSAVRLTDIPRVFRVPAYRRYVIGLLIYDLPFFFAGPFYQVFNRQRLQMTNSQIAWMTVGYCLSKMLASRRAGRWVDRWGSRTVLLVSGPLYVLFFFLCSLAAPGRAWLAYAAWALAGPLDAAFGICVQTGLYESVPGGGGRPAYFAVNNLLSLGMFAVGGLLGEAAMRAVGHAQWSVGPFVFGRYQLLFAVCGAAMVVCTFGALFWPGRHPPRQP